MRPCGWARNFAAGGPRPAAHGPRPGATATAAAAPDGDAVPGEEPPAKCSKEETAMPGTQPSVEERLEQLLRAGEFPPPPEFAEHAKVRDPAVYEEAAKDGPAWWAGQARERLDWQTPFSSVVDDSDPPFYSWFADGRLNASYNCLDR